MKHKLMILFVLAHAATASAQKDIFWADGGISFARLIPGASITYNYNVGRFLGLGMGAQLYDYHATVTNYQPVPALYWDVRFNIRSRKKASTSCCSMPVSTSTNTITAIGQRTTPST